MMIFLQVLGGIFLAIVIFAVAGCFYLKYRLRKFLGSNKEPIAEKPLIVHLNEELSADWLQLPQARQVCEELENLGFVRGKSYAIHEMEAFQLVSYAREPVLVAVYRHEALGTWSDVLLQEKDGREYTYSNAKMGSGFDQRPETEKKFEPGYSINQLVAEADRQIADKCENFIALDNSGFREFFEEAYKKDMAWKCRKGGVSYEEFLKTAAESGEAYKDQVLQEAFVQTKEDELYRWEQAALEQYQKSIGLSDDDFLELEDKLVVVPFTSSAQAFVNYLEDKGFVSDNQAAKIKRAYDDESNMISLFEILNEMLSPELRARHLTDADFPLPCKIYQLHESMSS